MPNFDGSGSLRVTRLSDTPDLLGESPVWDGDAQRLWWIDGVAGTVRWIDWIEGAPSTSQSAKVGGHIGAIALAQDGNLIVAREHAFLLFNPDSGNLETLFELHDANPEMRLNDGKLDRQGRFICAGMGRKGDALGDLHQLDNNLNHTVLSGGICVGNGVCFSPAGDILYFSDTRDRKVFACDYDPETGVASEPRLHINTAPLSSGVDGATVDRDGNLWAAFIQSAEIACFDASGTLVHRFPAPTDLPSSLAFGGADLQTLFVTSIRDSGSGRAVSHHPDGGKFFAITGTGATGLPEARFTLSDNHNNSRKPQ